MTGLEKILQQIQDEARQKAEEVIAQADVQAKEILQKAEADGETQCGYIAEQSKAAVENHIASAKSAAELARRRAILTAKQQIISDAIREAREEIRNLSDEDYFALILRMAAKYALRQDGEILFSPADLARLPSNFFAQLAATIRGGTLHISKQTRPIDGGFVLSYGGIEQNCSIDALFYAAHEQLQDQVQALLFA